MYRKQDVSMDVGHSPAEYTKIGRVIQKQQCQIETCSIGTQIPPQPLQKKDSLIKQSTQSN